MRLCGLKGRGAFSTGYVGSGWNLLQNACNRGYVPRWGAGDIVIIGVLVSLVQLFGYCVV